MHTQKRYICTIAWYHELEEKNNFPWVVTQIYNTRMTYNDFSHISFIHTHAYTYEEGKIMQVCYTIYEIDENMPFHQECLLIFFFTLLLLLLLLLYRALTFMTNSHVHLFVHQKLVLCVYKGGNWTDVKKNVHVYRSLKVYRR